MPKLTLVNSHEWFLNLLSNQTSAAIYAVQALLGTTYSG